MKKLLFLLIIMMSFMVIGQAAPLPPKEIIAEATYQSGDNDSPTSAWNMVTLLAKRSALEQAGTAILSSTTSQNYTITNDNVTALSAGTMEVKVLEKRRTPVGNNAEYYIKIYAMVYPDKLESAFKKLPSNPASSVAVLQSNPKVKIYNDTANQLLYNAVIHNDVEQVKQAFAMNANPNFSENGYNSTTPFFIAISKDSPEIVQTFIANGVDVNKILRYEDRTPLRQAVLAQSSNAIKLLVEAKANTNIYTKEGWSILHDAIAQHPDDIQTVKYIIESGVNINKADNNSQTALMLACKQGSIEIAHILVDAGANTNIRNNEGKRPLDLAIKSGNNELIKFLISITK